MGASNSTSGSGGGYTKKLYFDPEADSQYGDKFLISDEELRQKMETLIDVEEVIKCVFIYRHPLYSYQLTDSLLFHAFVVFETETWWWSIEKNNQNVTIQRSKKLDSVLHNYQRIQRIGPVKVVMKARGRGSVRDLIDTLWRQNLLNKPYDVIEENCKYFTANVFNHTNGEAKTCSVGAAGHLLHLI